MPAPNVLRAKQRAELEPLIEELNRLFAGRKRIDIAEVSGLTNYQVGRILGGYLPAPTYLDITRLVVTAEMTPNEAAHLVGLYDEKPTGHAVQSAYERRMLRLVRDARLNATQRSLLMQVMEATVRGLEGQAQLERLDQPDQRDEMEEEEEPKPVTPRRRASGHP